ncbi:MAG: diaminopimelate epimerase [Clostridiales bacterium]|jgi:diaminopimelate epimerase|nr:diaminopimelate epimerase [Clostridiales bacterium]
MHFVKMHGAGNDYIYVDCTQGGVAEPERVARIVSDRHFGIGGDGLILIGRASAPGADFRMDMYNQDGSPGLMCGNGIRCVAKFVHDRGLTAKTRLAVETLSGTKQLDLHLEGGKVASVTVDMGKPILEPDAVPVLLAGADVGEAARAHAGGRPVPEVVAGLSGSAVVDREISVLGKAYRITCVSMGNPHAVVFADEPVGGLDLERIGPAFERHGIFPERVNTEFVNAEGRDSLTMRVWERGAGETLACGTGTCAVLVAAVLCGRAGCEASVVTRGGTMRNRWDAATGSVFMTGPAATVFEGDIDIIDI